MAENDVEVEVSEGHNGADTHTSDEFACGASAHTENNCTPLVVKKTVSPGICCFPSYFYPVRGVVSVDCVDYEWNSRAHRKLRHMWGPAEKHPEKLKHRIGFLGWEPHIVSWWNIWIGEVANTLWVINGMYSTWPEIGGSSSEIISYISGVIGAFMFIITGYLGFVEAINHSHRSVSLPHEDKGKPSKRRFYRPNALFGKWPHPLLSTGEQLDYNILLEEGHPLIQDVKTGEVLTMQLLTRYNKVDPDLRSLVGRKFDILTGGHVLHVSVDDVSTGGELVKKTNEKAREKAEGCRWWTWHPDIHQLSIFLAIIYFISTILFEIPACIWYPQDNIETLRLLLPSFGSKSRRYVHQKHVELARDLFFTPFVFNMLVGQIIPCMGFVLVGHCSMAEASGSWVKPDVCNIGWWISVFNTIGSYGFMSYAVIGIWNIVDSEQYAHVMKWGADLGTFWGSCAFWVAGFLACFEFGSKHPIKI